MKTKNLIVIIMLAVFILASQKPAEAATGKNVLHVATRSSLRVVKWTVFFPGRWISYAHMVVPELCYYAFAGGEVLCDAIIQNDTYDQRSEAVEEANAEKRKQQAADSKAADAVKRDLSPEPSPSAEPALKPEIKSDLRSEGGE